MRHKNLNNIDSAISGSRIVNKHQKLSIGIKHKVKYGLSLAGLTATAGIIGLSQSFSGVSSALSISSLSQTSGSVNGGNTITIKGEGFLESVIKDDPIVDMESNNGYVFVVTKSGRVFSWGKNNTGQLANGNKINQYSPVEVTKNFKLDPDDKIINIEIGYEFAMAQSKRGKIFSWGKNTCLAMALGNNSEGRNEKTIKTTPVDITVNMPPNIVKMSLGNRNGTALTADEDVYTWGQNIFIGLPEDGSSTEFWNGEKNSYRGANQPLPRNITSQFDDKIIDINILFTLSRSGKLYVRNGTNRSDWNGDGAPDKTPIDITAKVGLHNNETIASMEGNYLLTSEGRVMANGSNESGQLGLGNSDDIYYNAFTQLPISASVTKILFTGTTSGVVTERGEVYTFGVGTNDNFVGFSDLAREVPGFTSSTKPAAEQLRPDKSNYLTELYRSDPNGIFTRGKAFANNKLYTWGNGWYGEVGDPNYYVGERDFKDMTNEQRFETYTKQIKPFDITANLTGLATAQSTVSDVRFGINKADYTVKDNNTIEVIAPTHAAGKVDVTITDNEGNKTVLKNGYEYVDNKPEPTPNPEDKPNKPEGKPEQPNNKPSTDNNTTNSDSNTSNNDTTGSGDIIDSTTPTITAPNTGV